MTRPSEHETWLLQVDKVAQQSTDRSTKIGAIIVDPRYHIEITSGFNHLTKGIPDDDAHSERPAKYLFWEHAERTAIYQAGFERENINNMVLYTTGIPCADCARAVVEARIAKVVVWKQGSGLEKTDRWYLSIDAGRQILLAAGVEIVEVARNATPEGV